MRMLTELKHQLEMAYISAEILRILWENQLNYEDSFMIFCLQGNMLSAEISAV